ncbi:Hypothetical predicted protein [Olea europaea subsp. europaea]|uniref:Uncharacterized protein n=1 Tax=Olea europaea subsp. europaea TaxID=158383 RepID=A0A8S0SAI1_OLEEU|nr:Hypothetical predicted protein [Olea europaea subsp. europaea]
MAKNRICGVQSQTELQREGAFCGLGRRTVDLQPAVLRRRAAKSELAEANARRTEEGTRRITFVVNSPSHRRRHSPDAWTVSMLRGESRWVHSRELEPGGSS